MAKKAQMLSDIAYAEMKTRIAKLPSGAYLSARQYAKDLGMSYTPIREAFLRLQKEGILKQVPNVGYFVESIDLIDLMQVFQVRECIESFSMRKVMYRIRPEHIEKLKEHTREMRKAMEEGDNYRYMMADEEFHLLPLVLLGNTRLLELYRNVRAQYMLCASQMVGTLTEEVMIEHDRIILAFEKKDEESATRELAQHISNMKQRLMESYVIRSE